MKRAKKIPPIPVVIRHQNINSWFDIYYHLDFFNAISSNLFFKILSFLNFRKIKLGVYEVEFTEKCLDVYEMLPA